MPANILNLPQYRVLRVEESDHDYHVTAEPVDVTAACPHCQSDRLNSWGTREQVFKDLPMHGKRVSIYIGTKRLRCQACGKTFSQSLPLLAENRMMTDRLVKWIGQQALKRTFTSLADETGVVEGTIRNIFRDYINELEQTVRFETPSFLGIGEIDIINKPRCVVSNIQNNTVLDMLHNRNKDTVAKYLFKMPNRDKVQYVAMDMWTPYRDAVTAVLPDATIVIDKFHVVRMANDAMEKARKGLRAELTLKQKRGLMHDRFVLLKRERTLNDEERLNLDGWTTSYPTLGEAYRLKEAFYAIYEDSDSPEIALMRYEAWSKDVSPEIRPYFHDLIGAFTNWQPFILNYFEHPVTNAYTESLNSLIRVMNRLGRGYSFEALRAKILFTEGIHSRKQARPKFERKRAPEPVEMGRALPVITFCCANTAPEPWLAALHAALPQARVSVWQPGAPAADMAVVWQPPQQLFDEQPGLKSVFNIGAGVDALLRLRLPPAATVVRLEDAGMAVQMAEYVCQAVIRHFRHLNDSAADARVGRWTVYPPRRRADFAVGVMGLGVLGARVAQALVGFDFPVNGYSRTCKALPGVRPFVGVSQWPAFLAASQVLVNLLPLTPDTVNLLNRDTLAQLPRGAYVINVARGAHLVDADLLALIRSGHLAGATLDVFRTEPLPPDHPFWHEPAIIVTPHTSARTLVADSVAQIVAKVAALAQGRPVSGVVDTARGY